MNYILIEGVDFCAVCHLVACYRAFKHGDSGIILTACRLERVVYVELCIAFVFLANLIQTSEVLPCVKPRSCAQFAPGCKFAPGVQICTRGVFLAM